MVTKGVVVKTSPCCIGQWVFAEHLLNPVWAPNVCGRRMAYTGKTHVLKAILITQ